MSGAPPVPLEAAGSGVCWQPHARHERSDVQSSINFLCRRVGQPFEIALAPAALLEQSMLSRIEDHLHRMFEALGDRCAMVILSDALAGSAADLPDDLVASLMERYVPRPMPVVVDKGQRLVIPAGAGIQKSRPRRC